MDATELLTQDRIVPVVVIEDKSGAVDLARTLFAAGINTIEVTLRTKDALPAIELIATALPQMLVGGGSVRETGQFQELRNCGAGFAVSPGATDALIQAAIESKTPFVPGACTASEILRLFEQGYRLQKFFPAELSGGVAMLKALAAPLPEIRFFPTGGISSTLAPAYLALPCVPCIGGSWFVPQKLLAARDYAEIGRLAHEAVKCGT